MSPTRAVRNHNGGRPERVRRSVDTSGGQGRRHVTDVSNRRVVKLAPGPPDLKPFADPLARQCGG